MAILKTPVGLGGRVGADGYGANLHYLAVLQIGQLAVRDADHDATGGLSPLLSVRLLLLCV
ncbi:MAG: hypothetical protein ABIZ80_07305 [Bryobacteraceae bacterium]